MIGENRSVARRIAELVMLEMGHNPEDFRTRDRLIGAISGTINSTLDEVASKPDFDAACDYMEAAGFDPIAHAIGRKEAREGKVVEISEAIKELEELAAPSETKEQFIERYSKVSGIDFDKCFVALPCLCPSKQAIHWAAITKCPDHVKTHLELYAPPGTEWPEEVPNPGESP